MDGFSDKKELFFMPILVIWKMSVKRSFYRQKSPPCDGHAKSFF